MKRYWLAGLFSVLLCLSACGQGGSGPSGTDLAPEAGGDAVSISGSPAADSPAPASSSQSVSTWEVNGDITLSLLQAAVPPGTEELTLLLENRGDLALEYGEFLFYERYVDGQWQAAETMKDYAFTSIGHVLPPHSVGTFSLSTWFLEKPLEEGLYRVTGSLLRTADEDGQPVQDYPGYQLTFLVTEEAREEPDYAVFVSAKPVSPESIPVSFLNMSGADAQILLIPTLEQENEDGSWSEVPFSQQVGFCGTLDPLPVGVRSWSESPDMLWGRLEDGSYRLSYTVTDSGGTEHTASGEFAIKQETCALPAAQPEE